MTLKIVSRTPSLILFVGVKAINYEVANIERFSDSHRKILNRNEQASGDK